MSRTLLRPPTSLFARSPARLLLYGSSKMFHRAGLSIIPLSYTLWKANRQRCLQAVLGGLSTGSETS